MQEKRLQEHRVWPQSVPVFLQLFRVRLDSGFERPAEASVPRHLRLWVLSLGKYMLEDGRRVKSASPMCEP